MANLPPVSTTLGKLVAKFALGVVDTGGKPWFANISASFRKNLKTVIMGYSGAGGKLIHEKNQKQKISWHCPFNKVLCQTSSIGRLLLHNGGLWNAFVTKKFTSKPFHHKKWQNYIFSYTIILLHRTVAKHDHYMKIYWILWSKRCKTHLYIAATCKERNLFPLFCTQYYLLCRIPGVETDQRDFTKLINMGLYAGVDHNSPYLMVNSVVTSQLFTPTTKGKGCRGEDLSYRLSTCISVC